MPTILRFRGLRVVIYFNDHHPPHVHVIGPGREARIALGDEREHPWLMTNEGAVSPTSGGGSPEDQRKPRPLDSAVERDTWRRLSGLRKSCARISRGPPVPGARRRRWSREPPAQRIAPGTKPC